MSEESKSSEVTPFEVIEDAGYIPRTSKKREGFNRQDVVNAFQDAFDIMGGTTRLALWANANPDKFYPLYAKLLPSQAVILGNVTHRQIVHAIPPTALDMHPGDPLEIVDIPQGQEVPRE